MIEHLSPREREELERAVDSGHAWAGVLLSCFADGPRLVLGIDRALSEAEIATASRIGRPEVREAIAAAARWCVGHGLHLLGYPVEDGAGEWRHFLAVG